MRSIATLALTLLLAAPSALAQAKSTPAPARGAKKVPQQDPFQELLNRADQAIARENYLAAIEALEKYTALRPEEAYGFFQLGYAHTGQKNWEQARQAYARATKLDPKMGAAHLNLGLIVLEHGEASDAVEPLRRAAELLADRAHVKFLLGSALEKSGQTKEAVTRYRAAIAQDAQNPEFHLALGRVLLNQGDFAGAQASFGAALKIRADVAQARLGLAQTLIGQSHLAQAAMELENYLRLVPGDSATLGQYARLLLELGQPQKTLAALDAAGSAVTTDPASLKLRAEALLLLRRFEEAAQILGQILAAEPENADVRALLGRLHLEKKDFPAAEKELLAALRLQPQHTDALRDLASTYYLGERYEAALRMQDLLAQRETPNAFFWFVRGTCFDKLGKKLEALEAYEKFVAMDQGRSEKQDFQARQRIRIIRRELEKNK
jgi:tetratricopeptide (TPR) repeat protein